ncbi:uncharacterized protein BDZ99DRAFT_376591 [Mytilinidion resinicola]|uniref:Uncharacterized protein n=1 Tax=Mytilinidion resinicola TaxID=574789 RepID=A0A6A6Z4M7_9PEZI|nr:uncharacterized protein BDZ99DRAFT_376591 [Mytilinidion resinicola]KAF2816026.1 hypothetical protein BDZ99DRAFT_376591 [Mytilinidion resinicola]
MDPASQALAQNLPTHVRRTYTALAECSNIPVSYTTQYLTLSEEIAFVQHILRTAALGFPLRIKDIPLLAFSIARR